jgi:hypothetical protein
MALSEAQRRANDKYIKEHYKQVKLSMPNDEAELLEEHCKEFQYSKAGFIRQAIREKIERERQMANEAGGGFKNPGGSA